MTIGSRERPAFSALGTQKELDIRLAMCKKAGFTQITDEDAGTVKVLSGKATVLRAIRKGGKGEPWIVSYYDAPGITWWREQDAS